MDLIDGEGRGGGGGVNRIDGRAIGGAERGGDHGASGGVTAGIAEIVVGEAADHDDDQRRAAQQDARQGMFEPSGRHVFPILCPMCAARSPGDTPPAPRALVSYRDLAIVISLSSSIVEALDKRNIEIRQVVAPGRKVG